MMRVWVTGTSGFIGSILLKELAASGFEVLSPKIDICDYVQIEDFVSSHDFDAIVHLAGISSVPECERDRRAAFDVNVRAVSDMAELVGKYRPHAHFIFPSTGLVYAAKPIGTIDEIYTESDEIAPRNYYGFTKYLAEQILKFKSQYSSLHVTVLRVFNHSHKSQRPEFFMSSIYKQLLLAKSNGLSRVDIVVGNIDVARDIGAAQDLVRAFKKVVIGPCAVGERHNVFNVSSGVPKDLRTLANVLSKNIGLEANYIVNPDLVRAGEPRSVVGSNAKLQNAYGWSPSFSSDVDGLVNSFLADI